MAEPPDPRPAATHSPLNVLIRSSPHPLVAAPLVGAPLGRPSPIKTALTPVNTALTPATNSAASPDTPRGRGRPKGWKPGMSYAQMRGTEPKKRPAGGAGDNPGEPKRRGRPPKPPDKAPRELFTQSRPNYAPFLCEWQTPQGRCPAELQNLETLRRHVLVVHNEAGCRWEGCQSQDRDHVERHLATVAWYMGDGCKNSGHPKPQELPRYLFDGDGVQVTPWVGDQEVEDRVAQRERKKKLRELLEAADEELPEEELRQQQMLDEV